MKKSEFELLYRWIRLAQSGIFLKKLLSDRNIKSVMLYGYNKITECVLYELKKSDIQVIAIIDKKGDKILVDYPAYKPDDISGLKMDAIIIMPVDDYGNIKEELSHYTTATLLSIEEIVYEL